MREAAVGTLAVVLLVVPLAGCGEAVKRQDANEPAGEYKVQIVEAEFPEVQKLAKRSEMRIVVKNVDTKRIPNIAVTVKSFDRRENDIDNGAAPQVADPRRPVFIVNESPIEGKQALGPGEPSLVDREVDPPRGNEAAGPYVDTYFLGPLEKGETATFEWDVTAIVAESFSLRYRVEAGLDGKAKAVLANGKAPAGVFSGVIEDRVFEAGVDPDGGEVITREGDNIGPTPPDRSNGPNDN